jgi:hypothetical protein
MERNIPKQKQNSRKENGAIVCSTYGYDMGGERVD